MYYIANVFFELELDGCAGASLREAFEKNPYFKQLQFLPLLFLSKDDTLLVTELPSDSYLKSLPLSDLPKIALLEDSLEKGCLQSWGASQLISKWAKVKGLDYQMPQMACCKNANSKLWNFERTQPLLHAKIAYSAEELEGISSQWVLKTDQGFAGRGHFVFDEGSIKEAIAFGAKQWKRKMGVILEPWVERVCDFSSQWNISREGTIELLGLTKCLNTESGAYLGTETGDDVLVFGEIMPYVKAHVKYCREYLKNVVREGFFGNLGVDSMVYKDMKTGQLALHPVVEVNARMTMSAAILLFHQKYQKDKVTRIYYCPDDSNKTNLLPDGFRRKLVIA
jgi:hypothetical protein